MLCKTIGLTSEKDMQPHILQPTCGYRICCDISDDFKMHDSCKEMSDEGLEEGNSEGQVSSLDYHDVLCT